METKYVIKIAIELFLSFQHAESDQRAWNKQLQIN